MQTNLSLILPPLPYPPLPSPPQLSSRVQSDSSVLLRQKTCQLMAAAACVQVARSAKQEGEKVCEALLNYCYLFYLRTTKDWKILLTKNY